MHCNRSHSCRNLDYSLIAFVVAFLVGLVAVEMVQMVSRLGYPSFTLKPDQATIPIVDEIAFGECSDNDPVSIRRNSVRPDGIPVSNPILFLSNRGFETIYYSLDYRGGLIDYGTQKGQTHLTSGKSMALLPGNTFVFSVDKYDRDPQVISFSYRIGDSTIEHRFAAYFEDSNPTPSGCAFN